MRTYLSMTLPVVKCILCPLLMLWLSMTPRIMEYSINMTRFMTSYYIMWLYYTWVFNEVKYLFWMICLLVWDNPTSNLLAIATVVTVISQGWDVLYWIEIIPYRCCNKLQPTTINGTCHWEISSQCNYSSVYLFNYKCAK